MSHGRSSSSSPSPSSLILTESGGQGWKGSSVDEVVVCCGACVIVSWDEVDGAGSEETSDHVQLKYRGFVSSGECEVDNGFDVGSFLRDVVGEAFERSPEVLDVREVCDVDGVSNGRFSAHAPQGFRVLGRLPLSAGHGPPVLGIGRRGTVLGAISPFLLMLNVIGGTGMIGSGTNTSPAVRFEPT